MRGITKRGIVATVAGIGAITLLAGCAGGTTAPASSGEAPELSEEPVTLRFTWWGNDARTAATEQLIDLFEEEYPNITIEPQFTDWGGYWDKLATETAANDTPDIIQMDEKFLATYGTRGALLDLTTIADSIDTTEFDAPVLATGEVDGARYGIPIGMTAYSLMTNPVLFEAAGLEIPDDETWTWDDYAEISAQLSAAGAGASWGTNVMGFEDGGLNTWARQHGLEGSFTKDGGVALTEEVLSSWWQYTLDLIKSGAAPSASTIVERQGGGLAESFTATNQAAFAPFWASQLTALTGASGSPIEVLRLPTVDGKADKSAYFKPSMFWSISARTDHPAEAALFVDWLSNSEEAADVLLTERGVPANNALRAYIAPKLAETDKAVVEFIDSLGSVVGDAPPVTPAGGSALDALLKQYTEQVLFERQTPEDAAKALLSELDTALAAG